MTSPCTKEPNRYLANEYGVDPAKNEGYTKWLSSRQPFYWFLEFYGIVHVRVGFDLIIVNPP